MLGISGVHLAVEGKGTADTPPSSGTRRFKERSNRLASYRILGRTDPPLSAAGKTLLSSTSCELTEPTPKSTQAPGSLPCDFPSLRVQPSPEGPPFVRGKARRSAARPRAESPERGRFP